MSFMWPAMLFSLALIPLLIGLYAVAQRRRRRGPGYSGSWLNQARPRRSIGRRRHLPLCIFTAGLALLLVALARPQAAISLPRIEGTVVLAFDVSGSMAADDLQPTRLEAAKAAALEFVQHQPPAVRIGIVAFSDEGFVVQPPTNDQDAILATINRLKPQSGTSVANGLIASLNLLNTPAAGPDAVLSSGATPVPLPTAGPEAAGSLSSAAIVMLTDGENNEAPEPLAAAQAAAEQGVRVYTVGIGSAAGKDLHINGFVVHTQLDESALQQIAQATGGAYYNAENTQELHTIYDNLDPKLAIKPETMEVTSIFAGAGLLALAVGGAFSLLWFGRLP